MHELSIAMALFDQVKAISEQQKTNEVVSIHISLGVLSGVDEEALSHCFSIACRDTPLESTNLFVETAAGNELVLKSLEVR